MITIICTMDSQDDTFGPHLPGAFDFTLLFEQSILSLLPTTLFIVAALWRFGRIVHRPTCVVPSMLSVVKLVRLTYLDAIVVLSYN